MHVRLPTNRTYQVEWSADLRTWRSLTNGVAGTKEVTGTNRFVGSGQRVLIIDHGAPNRS